MSLIRTRDRSTQTQINGFQLRRSGVLKAWPTAAPTFVGVTGTSSTNASLGYPTNTRGGDLAIAVIETSGDSATPSPSGWTALTGSPVVDVADATGSKLTVLYRIVPDNLANTTFSLPGGDHQNIAVQTFRGGSSGSVISTVTGTKTTASTSLTFPSFTVPAPNSLVIFIATHPSSTTVAQFSNLVNSNLTSITEQRDISSTNGNGGGYCVYTGIAANAGSIGTSTITLASSVTNACMVLALEPSIALPA